MCFSEVFKTLDKFLLEVGLCWLVFTFGSKPIGYNNQTGNKSCDDKNDPTNIHTMPLDYLFLNMSKQKFVTFND